jgi:voltage-gated potassium channel
MGLMGLIVLNVLAVMTESVAWIRSSYGLWLSWFEVFSVTVFVAEYLLRFWACTSDPRYRHPIMGRIRFAITPLAVVDLFAVLPTLLMWAGVDLRFLRILRLSRMLRLAKLGRYSRAMNAMGRVMQHKREELALAFMFMVIVLVVASSVMYVVEHDRQPEAFSSIPATMWWGVMTLTTVGYGDVYPITALGKLTAAVIAIAGIGLFALPAGIVASGFIELRGEHKGVHHDNCPHCGKSLSAPHEN